MLRTPIGQSKREQYDFSKVYDKEFLKQKQAVIKEVTQAFPDHEVFLCIKKVEKNIFVEDETAITQFRFTCSRNDESGKIFITIQVKGEETQEEIKFKLKFKKILETEEPQIDLLAE